MTTNLWIDDLREPPSADWQWEKTSRHAISYLKACADRGRTISIAPVHPDDVGTEYDESELVLKVVM